MYDLVLKAFEDLFPFYFQLNERLEIKSYGRSFAKLVDVQGFSFERDVEMVRPRMGLHKSFEGILSRKQQVFVLSFSNREGMNIKLKGQFISDDSMLVFCGSPWFKSAEEVEASGLVITDFAMHDTMLDVLHYIDLYRHSLDDVSSINDKNVRQRIFYEGILDRLPVEVSVFDKSHRYLYANQHAIPSIQILPKVIGTPEPEVMQLLHLDGDRISERITTFNEVKDRGGEATIIEHFKPHIGRGKYTLRKYAMVGSEDTEPMIISYAVDITALKEAEKKIAASFQEMSEIIESISDIFVAVDRTWKVIYWNERAEESFGIMREDMLGFDLRDKCSEFIDAEYFEIWENSMLNVHVERVQGQLMFDDRWYDITSYPFMGGLSVYFRDITVQKHHEQEMQRLNMILQDKTRKLEISNKDLEQYAYAASHDLQEPLRMITGFLGKLESNYGPTLDQRGKRYMEFARDGANRMRQIILDLLEYSRIGSEQYPLEETDTMALVGDVCSLLNARISETHAIIHYEGLPVVFTHQAMLQIIFLNLIGNALKYSRKGVTPEVTVSCKLNPHNYWEFCISDNGIGISEKYFEKIFVIFQRLHLKDEYTGTGIGLSITKKIVNDLNGEIWVESTEGEGSRFYFTLPAGR